MSTKLAAGVSTSPNQCGTLLWSISITLNWCHTTSIHTEHRQLWCLRWLWVGINVYFTGQDKICTLLHSVYSIVGERFQDDPGRSWIRGKKSIVLCKSCYNVDELLEPLTLQQFDANKSMGTTINIHCGNIMTRILLGCADGAQHLCAQLLSLLSYLYTCMDHYYCIFTT